MGRLSSSWYRLPATYAPHASNGDGSTIETRVKSPMSRGVTLVQFAPLLRDTQT
jgi:hypothetical protein